MNNTPDRCNQLRKLHEQLSSQVKNLRESIEQAEREGVANPLDALNTLKTLQASQRRVAQQLEECPPENTESNEGATPDSLALQQQAKTIQSTRWFPAQDDAIFDDDAIGSTE